MHLARTAGLWLVALAACSSGAGPDRDAEGPPPNVDAAPDSDDASVDAHTDAAPNPSAGDAGPRDPTFLYYAGAAGQAHQIYRHEAGQRIQLTHDPAINHWWVKVSPDGTRFLCYQSPYDGLLDRGFNEYDQAELWVYDIDGQNGRLLIDLTKYGWTEQGVAKWSPDGTRILMAARHPDVATHQFQLYVTDAEGEDPVRISQRNVTYTDPSFSHDGTRITYAAFAGDAPATLLDLNVYIADYDAVTGMLVNETPVFVDPSDARFFDQDPHLSPSGRYVAYQHPYDGFARGDMFVVDLETGERHHLVGGEGSHASVAQWWNETFLYFEHRPGPNRAMQVSRVRRDGSDLTTVLASDDNTLNLIGPSFIP